MKYVATSTKDGEITLIVPEDGGDAVCRVFKPEFADAIAEAVTAASFVPAHPVQAAQHELKSYDADVPTLAVNRMLFPADFLPLKSEVETQKVFPVKYGELLGLAREMRNSQSQWQDMSTAPKDGRVVNVVARYPSATAGSPTYAAYHAGKWWEYTMHAPQEVIPWAWRERDEWPDAPRSNNGEA